MRWNLREGGENDIAENSGKNMNAMTSSLKAS